MAQTVRIVALEGERGTGKTALAGALRGAFAVPVVDVGVYFRLLAAHVSGALGAPDTVSVGDAVERVARQLAEGSIVVDCFKSMPLAATSVFARGECLQEKLWSETAERHLRVVAESEIAISFVKRQLSMFPYARMLVVGRNVAHELCSARTFCIRLVAARAVRQARKRTQLSARAMLVGQNLDGIDPRFHPCHHGSSVTIDTTCLSLEEVFNDATSAISSFAGWTCPSCVTTVGFAEPRN